MGESQPLPLSVFCCQNERCEDYGKKGLDNLYQHGWTDRAETIRILRCRTCQREFSERKGTVWYKSQLPREKALSLARHLAEGDGIRKTGRRIVHALSRRAIPGYYILVGYPTNLLTNGGFPGIVPS